MKPRWLLEALARAVLFAFSLATSAYALLCGLEFAWNNLLKDRRFPVWVGTWLDHHAAIGAAVAALALLPLSGRRRWIWAGFAAICMSPDMRPGLSSLSLGPTAAALAFLAWLPYAAWELALGSGSPALDWATLAPAGDGIAPAGAWAGLFVAAAYAANAGARSVPILAWSLIVHAAMGCGLGLLFDAARVAASLSMHARRTQARLTFALIALAGASLIYVLAMLPLPFAKSYAAAYAAVISSLACLAASRQWASRPGLVRDLCKSRLARFAGAAAILLAPRLIRSAVGTVDWDFMFATLSAAGLWAAALLLFSAWPRRKPASWALPAALLACCLGAQEALARLDPWLRFSKLDLRAPAAALAASDPSLLALRRVDSAVRPASDFYGFLQRSTNIARSVPVAPKEINLSSVPPGRLGKYPNIFVIVIDSLRQDYVGAYNPAVKFTPSIDALAADSLVFRNAFTAYGATGLSEPSIWSGARLVHKQYVLPFSPMNSLEKLVVSEGYRRLITSDVILTALLDPATATEKLDEHTEGNYKLCGTLEELDGKLSPGADQKPIFAYTQPQDIHISVIQREGAQSVGPGPFGGFYAPYASRLARSDECLGKFVASLKTKGLYDDSIIVVAADHGDSLGEAGRWGHAYTLFPEILRVPLIVRVPERLKKGKVWDLDAPALLIDIAPTLYALLGRAPDARGGVYGRSLVDVSTQALAASVPKSSMEVSSYGPVYGLLQDGGRRLYIADGVNYQSYLYDLRADPKGLRNLSDPAAEALYNPPLRAAVDEVNAFYGFKP